MCSFFPCYSSSPMFQDPMNKSRITSKLSMKIPQPRLNEMHSKQPFHGLGRFRSKLKTTFFQAFHSSPRIWERMRERRKVGTLRSSKFGRWRTWQVDSSIPSPPASRLMALLSPNTNRPKKYPLYITYRVLGNKAN